MKKTVFVGLALLSTAGLIGHPHFNKRVIAIMPGGIEAIMAYRTVPVNEAHLEKVKTGDIVSPRGPRLTLTGEVMAGSVKVTSGTYTVGMLRKAADDWSLVLSPGRLLKTVEPDRSKLIHLESTYSMVKEHAAHIEIDITPAPGKSRNAVISFHFGHMLLEGVLTYPEAPVAPPDRTEDSFHGHP